MGNEGFFNMSIFYKKKIKVIKKTVFNCLPYIIVKDKFQPTNIGSQNQIPPEIYNKNGERMEIYYIKDNETVHTPYSISAGRYPEKILWDRYNFSLKTHFYSHASIFENTYPCDKKIGILRESEEILPEIFEKAYKQKDIIKTYNKILTYSDKILDKYDNAVFMPAGSVWYGTEFAGGRLTDTACDNKIKNISMVASAKAMCKLHKVRADIARHYKDDNRVDTYGNAVNNHIEKKSDALESYRYSIVLENNVAPYYFTEKILDCFASMTVPIYLGASKIGEFFNMDGIISLSESDVLDYNTLDKIIDRCNKSDYEARKEAVLDNYNRVQEYLCYEDYMCKNITI